MPQPIQTPLIGAALQRIFRLQGRVQPVLEDSVMGVVVLADLSEGQEPPVTRHCISEIDIAAVTLEQAVFQFRVQPGTLASLRRMIIRPVSTNIDLVIGLGQTFAVTPVTAEAVSFTEGRLLATNAVPGVRILSDTQVANLGTPIFRRFVAADTTLEQTFPPGWIIGTGNPSGFGMMEVATSVINVRLQVTIEWDEFLLF